MKNLNPFTRNNDDPQPAPAPEPGRFQRFVVAFRRFTWWVAAREPSTAERCTQGSQMRFTAIGLYMITILPVLAFVAMYQFLKPLQIGFITVVGAMIWACFVPMLERFAIIFQTGSSGIAAWAKASFRFAGAAISGFLVTEAIIVLLFASTIDREIRNRIDTQVALMEKKARVENASRRDELQADNKKLQEKIDAFRAVRDEADRLRHAEADGLLGHARGEDIHYARRKDAWERAAAEYEVERLVVEPKIAQNDAEIAKLEDSVRTRALLVQQAEEQARDFLALHQALFSIVISSPSAAMMYLLLFFGLLIVETGPLLQKLISKPDEYDKMLAEAEKHVMDENQLSDQMTRDSVKLERTLWDRVVKSIRDGSLDADAEKRLCGRVFAALISNLLARLFGGADAPDAAMLKIVFSVAGRTDADMTLKLPKGTAETLTLADVQEDIDAIGDNLDGGPQHFMRAETSLGKEVWVNEPLVNQLESDKRVVVRFGHPHGFAAHA